MLLNRHEIFSSSLPFVIYFINVSKIRLKNSSFGNIIVESSFTLMPVTVDNREILWASLIYTLPTPRRSLNKVFVESSRSVELNPIRRSWATLFLVDRK